MTASNSRPTTPPAICQYFFFMVSPPRQLYDCLIQTRPHFIAFVGPSYVTYHYRHTTAARSYVNGRQSGKMRSVAARGALPFLLSQLRVLFGFCEHDFLD